MVRLTSPPNCNWFKTPLHYFQYYTSAGKSSNTGRVSLCGVCRFSSCSSGSLSGTLTQAHCSGLSTPFWSHNSVCSDDENAWQPQSLSTFWAPSSLPHPAVLSASRPSGSFPPARFFHRGVESLQSLRRESFQFYHLLHLLPSTSSFQAVIFPLTLGLEWPRYSTVLMVC